jgi:hypothetical protein
MFKIWLQKPAFQAKWVCCRGSLTNTQPARMFIMYRMYHLKCNPNYNDIWKLKSDFNINKNNESFVSLYCLCLGSWTIVSQHCEGYQLHDCSTIDMLHVVCCKHLMCPENLLPFGSLLSHLVFLCQGMHCWMLHRQCQTILMWSSVWEWTYILLMNTSCSHLQSFCTVVTAAADQPGAHWVDCHIESWENPFPWFLFGLCFKWCTWYNCRSVFEHPENVRILPTFFM